MDGSQNIEFILNGNHVSVHHLPGEMLADLLRDRLGLTGTKIGCNEAECGSCTVLVDGEPVLSCIYPAPRVHGHQVITIEGLARKHIGNDELHPLQKAFILHGAVQCGYCIPGQILTAYALIQKKPDPIKDDIRSALKDTLCRCGAYPTLERAILAAAKAVRTGLPVEGPTVQESSRVRKVVGRIHQRPDAIGKVTGKTIYTDDLRFDGMLYGCAKRAGIPHAKVNRINVSQAQKLPGVRAVLTANEIPGEHNHGLVIPDWPVLVGVGERVRYVGDALALVAAENRQIAEKALSLIDIDYELLPVVSDPVQAGSDSVEFLHTNGNLLKHIEVRKGDVIRGFAEADIILEETFHTQIAEHAFLEPECSIARLTQDGRMEIFVGSQIPYEDRRQVARCLGWPENRVRIIGMPIGGGFGGKEDISGQIHAALLCLATKLPVKILYDRHESFLVHPKRHSTTIRVKIGAKQDGTMLAVETELYGDTGAYASLGEKVMTRATTHSSGPYSIPNVKADCYAMYTNNPPAGAFRGFGVSQSAFAIESMIDSLAHELKLDPIELRRMNALKIGSKSNTGQVLRESVGLLECIDRVESEMRRLTGAFPFSQEVNPDSPYKRKAWGFAVAYKNTGLGGGAPDKAGCEVELCSDGMIEVRTSSAELGQGLPTVLQLIVAEELSCSPEQVRILLSDTDLTPDGGPTTASRQTFVTGNAARGAAIALRDSVSGTLSEKYDLSPDHIRFENGLVHIKEQAFSYRQIAAEMKKEGSLPKAVYEYRTPVTFQLGEPGDMHFAFSFAAQAAQVEVNTCTGEVKVLRIIAANDVGTVINPLGLQGQVEGGIMMGLGYALNENFIVEKGIVITDRLARYRIPSIQQTPEITSFVVESPTSTGPYGAKGVGEIVSIPTTPAITNAIYNAVGIRVTHLPVDQEFILGELSKKDAEMK